MILLITLWTLLGAAKLEDNLSKSYAPPKILNNSDAVLINFPQRSNATKTARHLYIPPDEDKDYFLPEVVDNRVRQSSGLFRPFFPGAPLPSMNTPPEVGLRAPPISSEKPYRNFLRPNTVSTKNSASGLASFTGISGTSGIESIPKDSADFYVQVNSMSCQNSGEELFFRASLRPPRKSERPIIDGLASENCRIERIDDEYRINFSNELFWSCGMQDCSTDRERFFCLNVRFPAIAGLRLKEDHKVTLRCRTQDKTASHIKRLNVKTLDTSARNAPKIETGGYKSIFETEVGLYRKTYDSGHLFDAKIQPGGTVILGEEVLLRAAVREGDGWRYSRISDVTVHYVEKSRRSRIMNSLGILDSNGCLNPEVREICSREQYRVSPLENYLMFEAFMFDNMKITDEMVMNVRITGCLDGADCVIDCPAGHSRRSRSVQNNLKNETIEWMNDITFRVTLPDNVSSTVKKSIDTHFVLPYILSAVALATIVVMLTSIKIVKKQSYPKI